MEPMMMTTENKDRRASRAWRLTAAGTASASPDAQEHRRHRAGRSDTWHTSHAAKECMAFPTTPRVEEVPAAAVLSLSCRNCSHCLSERGMKVQMVLDPNTILYSTDDSPDGIVYHDKVGKIPGPCGCQVQDIECRCGLRIGYHNTAPCSDCQTAQEDGTHQWFMSRECVLAEPRLEEEGLLLWHPDSADENAPPGDSCFRKTEVPPLPSYGQQRSEGRQPFSSPLSDNNGRTRADIKPSASMKLEDPSGLLYGK
ncbi:unnamed protein product, partial [Polarella glacialis]